MIFTPRHERLQWIRHYLEQWVYAEGSDEHVKEIDHQAYSITQVYALEMHLYTAIMLYLPTHLLLPAFGPHR